jgi:hypothetical protein
MEGGTLPLTAWESFYVIVGSSAAALTGLQFVVMTLIAGSQMRPTSREIAAFGSPTIVHFCVALFISATMSAPWQSLFGLGVTIAGAGVAGATYAILVMRRARRQTGYSPVFQDWLWHVALPLVAYLTLLITGIMLRLASVPCLFVISATTLLLVYIGIHNAWDTVIFVTLTHMLPSGQDDASSGDTQTVPTQDRASHR